jgi:hypothetical protein
VAEDQDKKWTVRAAALNGWARGVPPVGWNSKPGQEYICFKEQGEKADPDELRRDMFAAGWNEWPDTHKDGTMEFSLYPVPVRMPATAVPLSEKFTYSGVDGQYPVIAICATALCLAISAASGIHPVAIVVSLILPALVLHPVFRLRLEAFDDHFTFKKSPFSTAQRVAYADVARVRIIAVPIGRGGHSSWHFVFVTLKSGKQLRIYLPETTQERFMALLNGRIS